MNTNPYSHNSPEKEVSPCSVASSTLKSCRARPFKTADRAAVRRICCETGFMGQPVDPLYSDRDVFANFFTAYYTDYEPEHCLVAESEAGEVVGYIVAATHPKRYTLRQTLVVLRDVPLVLWKMLSGQYGKNDFRFLRWLLFKSGRETPEAPKRAAHFHINVLPRWRGTAGRPLMMTFLKTIPTWGTGMIYGQMQVYETRRSERVFKRFGFHLYDKRKVTKFARFGIDDVHVATLVRDFGTTE